ncbi:MAG: hypothetical protein Q7N95_18070 [Alphaproteobacteria bacterium]|nr:hypothetical protein [Alphaproteobacteria bacterium]
MPDSVENEEKEDKEEKDYWLERPGNLNKIIYGLFAACAFFALLDLVLPRHSVFAFEAWPAFYAWYGFIGCVGLVLVAKVMRLVLMRGEDYYD